MKWPWTRSVPLTRTFDVGTSTVSVYFDEMMHKVEFVGRVAVKYGYSYRHPYSYLSPAYARDMAETFINSNEPIETEPGLFIPRNRVASYEVKLESLLIEMVIPE